MGATGDEDIYIHAAHAPASALAALRKLVDEKKPFLIIIDPLQKMMRAKDTNDYAEITLALEPFLILARESGAHIAVPTIPERSNALTQQTQYLARLPFLAAWTPR